MDVKSGYGRNFLLPQGKAIPANDENLKIYEAEKAKLLEAEEQKISQAKEVLEKLNEFNLLSIVFDIHKPRSFNSTESIASFDLPKI